jgi:hypothetical protein
MENGCVTCSKPEQMCCDSLAELQFNAFVDKATDVQEIVKSGILSFFDLK